PPNEPSDFPRHAAVPRGGEGGAGQHPAAGQPREGDHHHPRQARPRGRRNARLGTPAAGRRGGQGHRPHPPARTAGATGGAGPRGRRPGARVGRPAPDGIGDEPAALAEAARLHLREKFLRAKVAVSGGNFAIAETGTVVVLESEGNGRMCLTLPQVLVTVLGIEKLLPTWADL